MATRFQLNHRNIRELLRSDAVKADLEARARRIASAAGSGHRVEVDTGRNRARAAVITDTMGARRAEARDRSLTRSLDAGRG